LWDKFPWFCDHCFEKCQFLGWVAVFASTALINTLNFWKLSLSWNTLYRDKAFPTRHGLGVKNCYLNEIFSLQDFICHWFLQYLLALHLPSFTMCFVRLAPRQCSDIRWDSSLRYLSNWGLWPLTRVTRTQSYQTRFSPMKSYKYVYNVLQICEKCILPNIYKYV
jgi:hypothetical protein